MGGGGGAVSGGGGVRKGVCGGVGGVAAEGENGARG